MMASPGMQSPGFQSPMPIQPMDTAPSLFPAVLPYHTPASVASRRAMRDAANARADEGRSIVATSDVGAPGAMVTHHRPTRRPPAVAMAPRALHLADSTGAELRFINTMCDISAERLHNETPELRRRRLAEFGSALVKAEATRADLEAAEGRRMDEAATRIQTAY